MTQQAAEVAKRRTFAIISHPDAGKTTITEKLLLMGKAISVAGTVKSRKSDRHATSDWMEMEKQRGISITTSVMQFPYRDHMINLLDTPGHEDFSEDTYRTLTAVDSALMVLDGGKGVEPRTIALMDVCRLRDTPIVSFINKLDRDIRDPIELLDEIEAVLKIKLRRSPGRLAATVTSRVSITWLTTTSLFTPQATVTNAPTPKSSRIWTPTKPAPTWVTSTTASSSNLNWCRALATNSISRSSSTAN
ncbi:hypothetical protein PSA5_02250 [Pseudomonas syringae pv. actinidiae]|nr:hypothetical protein PSA5_02250 [Pseudomonas syringae pv. actinidiae]